MRSNPLLLKLRNFTAPQFFTAWAFTALLGMPSEPAFAVATPAGSVGEFGLQVMTERTEDSGTASSERHLRANVAAGWASALNGDHSLAYGASFRSERGFQNGAELSGYGLGVFLSWFHGPFSVRADYIVIATQKSNNGVVETEFREGRGISLQVRWLHWPNWFEGDRIGFGPSLTFEQIRYAKSRVGSLPETGTTRTTESFTPGLIGVFLF